MYAGWDRDARYLSLSLSLAFFCKVIKLVGSADQLLLLMGCRISKPGVLAAL